MHSTVHSTHQQIIWSVHFHKSTHYLSIGIHIFLKRGVSWCLVDPNHNKNVKTVTLEMWLNWLKKLFGVRIFFNVDNFENLLHMKLYILLILKKIQKHKKKY